MLLYPLETLVRLWLGAALRWTGIGPLDSLLGARYVIAIGFLNNLCFSILYALLLFFLIFLLRVLTRRQWLGAGIFVLIGIAQDVPGSGNPMITALFSCLFSILILIALLRFGFVALTTTLFVDALLLCIPITTDLSVWYAGNALAVLLAVLALAAFAFRTSLGGQKVFAGKLLDE